MYVNTTSGVSIPDHQRNCHDATIAAFRNWSQRCFVIATVLDMDVSEALQKHHMTRSFDSRPIDPNQLDAILRLAARSPSAGSSQGIDMLVLVDQKARDRFWNAASSPTWRATSSQAPGLLAAPVIVIPVASPLLYFDRYAAPDKVSSDLSNLDPKQWEVPYWLVDAAFMTMALLIAATGIGLATLFFRFHNPKAQVMASFDLPSTSDTIGAIAIGHRQDTQQMHTEHRSRDARRRRDIDEVTHYDRW